jgi:hypothetical protein
MRKSIIAGAAITASFALAGTAQASSPSNPVMMTTFDGFDLGTVNGQDGWLAPNTNVDQDVIDVEGDKKFRISNAFFSGSFGDMPHSKPVLKPAGENEAANVLVNKFTIKAPDTFVPGLAMAVSPDDGQGSRMSRVRFNDTADGINVLFDDSTFVPQTIATELDRTVEHTVEIETTFVHGHDNDVVRVIIDGTEVKRGGSWENYYRSDEERNPSASDRLLIRPTTPVAPATLDNGFLFDNVSTESKHVDNPAPLHSVVLPQGPKGDTGDTGATGATGATGSTGADGSNGTDGKNGSNGTTGVNGKDGAAGSAGKDGVNGVTTIIHDRGPVTGASIRTIHASKFKGMKFIGVRASLRGKRLAAHGRTIKVDLRGKSVGNYLVHMTAKYKKGGKIVKVRSIRSLNIVRK